MHVIRRQQMEYLARDRRAQLAQAMCLYLRTAFQAQLWAVTHDELQRQVDAALAQATSLGLSSQPDYRCYLSLCVTHGWDFLQQRELAWMRAMLMDSEVSSPSQRLRRLVEHGLYRSDVTVSNQRLQRDFGVTAKDADEADELDADGPAMLLTTKA